MTAAEQPVMTAAPADVRSGEVPHCVVVTGPRGAGKTRWLQHCIREVLAQRPGVRCAILLAEEGRTRMEAYCADLPDVSLRKLFLPCLCCPGASDLSGAVGRLVEETGPDWLFLELPVIAAPGLLAEFDRQVGIPRTVVMRLTPDWVRALEAGILSPFQSGMFDSADAVITTADEAERATGRVLSLDAFATHESPMSIALS